MPYILYPLGAAAQDNCHCQLSSSRDIGVRTRGGRALCAYLRLRELGSAAFCRKCGGALSQVLKRSVAGVIKSRIAL